MKANFELEQFSGPLDLLLSLIDEQKLNINELAISEVTEQYLKHLDTLAEIKPEELADFLVIATRLLLLKSKNLLPELQPDDDEGPSLENQLKLYKAFLDASKILNKKWLENRVSSFRVEPPRLPEGFTPPGNFALDNLHESMLKLINRLKPLKELPETRIDRGITMKEKLEHIKNLLKKFKNFSFNEILQNTENRTEVIMTFLALLELVKEKQVSLKQDETFSDITVSKM